MKGRQIYHIALMMVIIGASAIYTQEMFPSRQLTTDSAREGFPSWSPDGQTIVYFFIHSIDGRQLLGSRKISSKGGEPIQFTDFPTEHPQWSPDGKRMAYASAKSGNGDIFVMDVDINKVTTDLKLLNQ